MWTYLLSARWVTPKVSLSPGIQELALESSGYVEQLHDVKLIKMVVFMDAKALREIADVGT